MNTFYLYAFSLLFFLMMYACQSNTSLDDKQEKNALSTSGKDMNFELIGASKTGINFNNVIQENPQANVLNYEYFYHGGGVAIGDINNDGLPDIYFVGNMVPDRLYLNEGNFKFKDITETADINMMRGDWRTGVVMADVNNDGWLDIYISRSGLFTKDEHRANLLFINNKNNTFTEKGKEFGLNDPGYSIDVVFFDYDKDGDNDMYLVNHPLMFRDSDIQKLPATKKLSDKLYRNNGNGTFTGLVEEAGLAIEKLAGLSVSVSDINQDGWLDMFVANDYDGRDFLYINQQNGKFKEQSDDYIRHTANNSMGTDIADFNNDGLPDIVVVDMLAEDYKRSKTMMATMNVKKFWKVVESGGHYQYMRNCLQMNNGPDKVFSEVGQLAGVSKTDWSWSPLMADFDNDGLKDLFVSNGILRDITENDFKLKMKHLTETQGSVNTMQALNMLPSNKLQNYMFQNKGNIQFSNKANDWGMSQQTFSNGAAIGDLDKDGDLDLVLNNMNDLAFLYRNNVKGNNFFDHRIDRQIG